MLIEFSNFWIVLMNCLGIPLVHLGIAWWSTRLPSSFFKPDGVLYQIRESRGFYARFLRIRRWKHFLPDAAPWFKGFSKGKLRSTAPAYMKTFIVETCRGEFSHWLQFIVLCFFILWNPWPANLVIIIYAVLMNFPCIANLRFTRMRLLRSLDFSPSKHGGGHSD